MSLLPDLQVRMGVLKRSSGAPFFLRAQTFQLEFHLPSAHVLKSQHRERSKVCRPGGASETLARRGCRDRQVSSHPTYRAETEPREGKELAVVTGPSRASPGPLPSLLYPVLLLFSFWFNKYLYGTFYVQTLF